MKVILTALLILLSAPAYAQTKVYVFTKKDVFVDAAARKRVKLVEDIVKKWKGSELVEVVNSADKAQVTVEVVAADVPFQEGATTRITRGAYGGARAKSEPDYGYYDSAVVRAGAYATTIDARHSVLLGMRRAVEGWLKDNASALNVEPSQSTSK